MQDTKRQENFKNLKAFFIEDMKIKEGIIKLAPTELDDYDESSRIEYTDKLYKELKYLEETFIKIIKSLELGDNAIDVIREHFNKSRELFLKGHYEKGEIEKLYRDVFSNMDFKLVELVKENCVGYFLTKEGLGELINKSKSINELLHVVHSYICNSDDLLKSMPILASKDNEEEYPITLYGEQSETAKKIFEEFPISLMCGSAEIVSMENMILIMVRDRGHALSINIDISNKDNILVKYFIPKLCDRGMIEKLPGINKSGITNNGATGMFSTTQKDLSHKLFNFIGRVPMDGGMGIMDIYEESDEPENEEESHLEEVNGNVYFEERDAKDLAMDTTEQGTRIGKIIRLKDSLKNTIKGLINKGNNKNDIDR